MNEKEISPAEPEVKKDSTSTVIMEDTARRIMSYLLENGN